MSKSANIDKHVLFRADRAEGYRLEALGRVLENTACYVQLDDTVLGDAWLATRLKQRIGLQVGFSITHPELVGFSHQVISLAWGRPPAFVTVQFDHNSLENPRYDKKVVATTTFSRELTRLQSKTRLVGVQPPSPLSPYDMSEAARDQRRLDTVRFASVAVNAAVDVVVVPAVNFDDWQAAAAVSQDAKEVWVTDANLLDPSSDIYAGRLVERGATRIVAEFDPGGSSDDPANQLARHYAALTYPVQPAVSV